MRGGPSEAHARALHDLIGLLKVLRKEVVHGLPYDYSPSLCFDLATTSSIPTWIFNLTLQLLALVDVSYAETCRESDSKHASKKGPQQGDL